MSATSTVIVRSHRIPAPSPVLCDRCRELLSDFAAAVHELMDLKQRQLLALIEDESHRKHFDVRIAAYTQRRTKAKHAYIKHRELHDWHLQTPDNDV